MNLLGIDYDNVKFKLATKFWMSFGRCYSIELDRETMFMGVRDITIISKAGKKALQISSFETEMKITLILLRIELVHLCTCARTVS